MRASRKSDFQTIERFDLLPPDPATRKSARPSGRPILVEDAVFEVVGPVSARDRFNDNAAPLRPVSRQIQPMRLLAQAGVYLIGGLERLLSHLSTQAFTTLTASIFLFGFWLFGGFSVLATQPVLPSPATLSVEGAFFEPQDSNGMKLLAVGGTLVNRSTHAKDVPSLSVVSADGRAVGRITPEIARLAPGASISFSARFQFAGGKSSDFAIFPDDK